MPISFGKRKRTHAALESSACAGNFSTQLYTRLVDIRNPKAFQAGFIPGSYNVPDLTCALAAAKCGLFEDRQIYVLSDDIQQLDSFFENLSAEEELRKAFESSVLLEPETKSGLGFQGWFGPESVEEWKKVQGEKLGSLDVVNEDQLAIRVAIGNTVVLAIQDRLGQIPRNHASTLNFTINELPFCLEGLPVETYVCVTSSTIALASFAASLLWNFGFHRIGYSSGKFGLTG